MIAAIAATAVWRGRAAATAATAVWRGRTTATAAIAAAVASGAPVAGIVGVLVASAGCGHRAGPGVQPSAIPAAAAAPSTSADPCDAGGPPGSVCSATRPAAGPVALDGGVVRLVFAGELPPELHLAGAADGCQVVDVDATGARVIASGCCDGVVSAALDPGDRFYVLCARSDGENRARYRVERLDGGQFRALPDSVVFAPRDPSGAQRAAVRRTSHLLIAGRTMVVAHDVWLSDGPHYQAQTFVQPLRRGAAAVAVDAHGGLFQYYAVGETLYGLAAVRDQGQIARHELGARPRRLGDLPAGTPSRDCDAWSGAGDRAGRPLELRVVPPGVDGLAAAIAIPGGRAVPSATSRGPAPAICNGAAGEGWATLAVDGQVVAHSVDPGSVIASCAASCVLAFTTHSPGVGGRFHLHRVAGKP